jgi:hypothetical protein
VTTSSGFNTRLAVSYLNSPRCGLSIKLQTPWLTIEHCPRCAARSRTVFELFGSGLPAEALYAAGAVGAGASGPLFTGVDSLVGKPCALEEKL